MWGGQRRNGYGNAIRSRDVAENGRSSLQNSSDKGCPVITAKGHFG